MWSSDGYEEQIREDDDEESRCEFHPAVTTDLGKLIEY